jgi:hypothetical protein
MEKNAKIFFDGTVVNRGLPCRKSSEDINELSKNWKEFPPPRKKRKVLESLLKV